MPVLSSSKAWAAFFSAFSFSLTNCVGVASKSDRQKAAFTISQHSQRRKEGEYLVYSATLVAQVPGCRWTPISTSPHTKVRLDGAIPRQSSRVFAGDEPVGVEGLHGAASLTFGLAGAAQILLRTSPTNLSSVVCLFTCVQSASNLFFERPSDCDDVYCLLSGNVSTVLTFISVHERYLYVRT